MRWSLNGGPAGLCGFFSLLGGSAAGSIAHDCRKNRDESFLCDASGRTQHKHGNYDYRQNHALNQLPRKQLKFSELSFGSHTG